MKRLLFTAGVLLLAAPLAIHGQRSGPSAGGGQSLANQFLATKERWAVKTGADVDARAISLTPLETTVSSCIAAAKPADASTPAAKKKRVDEMEKTVFTIDADIIRFKLETEDHDFHIVIRDHGDTTAEDPSLNSGERRTMIVEVPDPDVVVASSPWRNKIASVRAAFTSRFNPQTAFTRKVIHVRVTGVGMFDFPHGQSGKAPNDIELHPVIGMEFLP